MNSKFLNSIGAATCLMVVALSSHAETRTEWGSSPFKGAAQLDDSALMEVSGRGSIEESAVKALQGNGKLAEYLAQANQGQTGQGSNASESAEKQAIQTQLKMAMGATQTVASSIQLTGVVTSVAAPVTFAPVMGLPFFGLPIMPQR